MYHKEFLFIISLLRLCRSTIERDLLLTPKEGRQIYGRTLYYDPSSWETNGTVPWEQTLKHVTFLTLFTEAGRGVNLNDLREYKRFMESPYTRINEEYPRFGDIITMAQGRLAKAIGYRFIEGDCEQNCTENVLALWRVQKIRHRDSKRGFRYEMKFSVSRFESESVNPNKHPFTEQYFKSFVLKDDDYPESFNKLTWRSDNAENFSNERQARIINEIPRRENDILSELPVLNIGEYFKEVPKASSKIGYPSSARPVLPTTYRPNYHVKFPKPEVFEPPEEPKTVVTHHFHHHFFMNDAEARLHHDQQLFHGNPDAIRIIEGPNAELMSPHHAINVDSALYKTTTTAPSLPPLIYMQPIPLYIHSFPNEETTARQAAAKPFKQSEQQIEKIRYSDPDPLFENEDSPSGSSETASAEIHQQLERPSPQVLMEPDSINAQLPSTADSDTRIPYIDDQEEEITTNPPTTPLSHSLTRKALIPNSSFHSTPEISHKIRNFLRTTTEQPVLKWKPKRKLKRKLTTDRPSTVAVQSSTEKRIITVTPSKMDSAETEFLTQKSVSKSISVKIGNHSEELPLITEIEETVFHEPPDAVNVNTNKNDIKP